jgi:hypothetical protein
LVSKCLRSTPIETIDDEELHRLHPETATEDQLAEAEKRMRKLLKFK